MLNVFIYIKFLILTLHMDWQLQGLQQAALRACSILQGLTALPESIGHLLACWEADSGHVVRRRNRESKAI